MSFTLALAFRIIVVGLAIAIAIGGAALIIYGITRLLRRRATMREHEPGYSLPVESDGPGEAPADFEDAPRWLDPSIAPEPARSSHSADDPRASVRESRRGGVISICAGALLLVVGVVLASQTWAIFG